MYRRRLGARLVTFLLALALAAPAGAGFDSGDLLGTVSDPDGRKVAEALIVLKGAGAPLQVKSDAQGRFRLHDLRPGSYSIEVSRPGYSQALYEPVNIRLGRTTTVQVQLSAAIEETIVVTSEPPVAVADVTPPSATVLPGAELQRIPRAADPWAAWQQAPGITVAPAGDGGGTLVAPGGDPRHNAYAVDGAVAAGPGEGAPSPALFDLASAARVEITTGGSDPALPSAGTIIHLETRRGTDEARADVRASLADHGRSPSAGGPADGVETTSLLDLGEYGGDAGGPLLRDHLWGWGSFLRRDLRREAVGGTREDTRLRHAAAKLDARLGRHTTAFAYHRADLRRTGEGAGPDRAFETTLIESEPSELLSLEDTWLLDSDFYLTARYARLDNGRWQTPVGALDADIVLGEDGVWRGTYGDFRNLREARDWRVEGAALRRRHQIRFGASQRAAAEASQEQWGTSSLLYLRGENFGTPYDVLRLVRPSYLEIEQEQLAVWTQGRLTLGRFTLDAGLRHTVEHGDNRVARADSHPLFPELLPALDSTDVQRVSWRSLAPRLGAAWALDREARTVLRGSVGMFASPLYSDVVSRIGPGTDAEVYLGFEDSDLDGRFALTEPYFVLGYKGVDLDLPNRHVSPHRNAVSLAPERTDELRLSLDRQWRSGLQLSLELVERRISGVLETRYLVRDAAGAVRQANAGDYRLEEIASGYLPDGAPFAVPIYGLRDDLTYTGGSLLENGDRRQRYQAATLALIKPLADRWMLRSHLTVSDWRWQLGNGFQSFDDPTDLAPGLGDAGVSTADNDGDVVVQPIPGDRVLLNGRWSFNVFALYQVAPHRPWGFDVAANVHGREGYPLPYTVAVAAPGNEAVREVQVTPRTDAFRLDDVYTVDLRLEKGVHLGDWQAIVSLDVFNLADAGYVLDRERQLNGPQAGRVRETLNPRAFRIGLRFAWR